HIAAAVDLVELYAALGEELVRSKDVGPRRVASQGEHRRMLEQQKRVANEVRFAGGNDPLLDHQAFGVGNAAEMEQVQVHQRPSRPISVTESPRQILR